MKLLLLIAALALPLAAQQVDLGENVKGKLPPGAIAQDGASTGEALIWNGSAWVPGGVTAGVGVEVASSASAVASLTIDLTPLDITNTQGVQFQCWTGTSGSFSPVSITGLSAFSTTTVTLNFSSTANVYCSALGGTNSVAPPSNLCWTGLTNSQWTGMTNAQWTAMVNSCSGSGISWSGMTNAQWTGMTNTQWGSMTN